MANKAISELPQAQNVQNQDLFVLEQSGIAKKLAAETFITEQGIIDALAEALDGHGGIQSVTLSSVSGRIRTYLITFTDGSATTFQVLDGTSIDRIAKTSTAGLVDTYTIFMSDGTTSFFSITNGADGTVSEAMLNDALKDKAPAITETTESSAIATFSDGADNMVMHNVVVEINPVQSGSGDPSPSNIRPITGHTEVNVTRTGANVWDEEWEVGGLSTSTGAAEFDTAKIRSKNFCACKPRTTYCKVCVNPATYVWYYDIEKNFISFTTSATTFTTPDNCYYFKIRVGDLSHPQTTYNNDISINYPSSDTSYHAYSGTSLTTSWQTEAGTVYGGTIDVATGVLTVTHGYVDLGTLTYTLNSHAVYGQYFWGDVSGLGIRRVGSYSITYPAICSKYKCVGRTSLFVDGTFCFDGTSVNVTQIQFKDSAYSDAASFKTAMSGVQLVYELATPQTYQLSKPQLNTLFGNNTVWTDLGDVSVTYPADTKMYIENLTQPTEDDMTANQAISSGTFFMVGNTLYKATAAIANGATITPGTNATKLSLADALNLLNT